MAIFVQAAYEEVLEKRGIGRFAGMAIVDLVAKMQAISLPDVQGEGAGSHLHLSFNG